jgi:hypothetical protein
MFSETKKILYVTKITFMTSEIIVAASKKTVSALKILPQRRRGRRERGEIFDFLCDLRPLCGSAVIL